MLQDIVKIKQPSGNNTYAQVLGGFFVFNGLLILASSQGVGDIVFFGMTTIALGLPLL